ncbi:MAG: DUF3883 domain-containing protein [Acholeplasmataceae bacterium]|nr:DUF3883 domain-containing protein [Acholeplasmataceae bacterium]
MEIENKTIENTESIEEIAEIERSLNLQLKNAGWDSVKRVLSDMYKEPSHFIFELLQNAENVFASRVAIYLESDKLIFTHNGTAFSLNDIKRICQAGNVNQEDTRGKFGIGFKSVYKITETPYIYSYDMNYPSFRIEDYNVPIRIDSDNSFNIGTKFVLNFDADINITKTYKIVESGLKLLNEDSIMFSDYIKNIEIFIDGKKFNEISIVKDTIDKIDNTSFIDLVVYNKQKEQRFLLFQREISYFDEYKKKELNRNISIAYLNPKFDIEDKQISTSKLSVLFPTEVDTHLRFKIDAPFNTSYTREQVSFSNNEFNETILKESLNLYENSILILKKHNLLTIDLIYFLANSSRPNEDYIYLEFYNKTIEAFENNELLLSNDGIYIKASIALLCRDNKLFMEILSENDLKTMFDGRYKWIDGTGIKSSRNDELRRFLTDGLDITDVEFNTFNSRITTSFFDDKTDEWLMKFYDICLLNVNNIRNNPKPIIRNIHNKMRSPLIKNIPDVFLPSEFVKSNDKAIKKTFLSDETSMSFFKKLGIKEANALDLIKEEWIPVLKSLTDESELTESIEEILNIINGCQNEQKELIIKELKDIEFFPCTKVGTNVISFLKPKDIYLNTKFLRDILKKSNAHLILSKTQQLYEINSWFQELIFKLGVNSFLKIIPTEKSYHYFIPRKVTDQVNSNFPKYEISTQKMHSFVDYNLDFLSIVLSNLVKESSKQFWNYLVNIPNKYFTSTYEIYFKYVNEVARGSFPSEFIEQLIDKAWIHIGDNVYKTSDISKIEFRNEYNAANNELEGYLNFKPIEDISNLSQTTKDKVELTSSRSVDEVREALALLDDKKKQERIAQLKVEYLYQLFEDKLLVTLTETQKSQLESIDYHFFNNFINQKILFNILQESNKTINQFNEYSELKFDKKNYFEMILKQMVSTNEDLWISSLYHKYKSEVFISNKLKFSEDLIRYQQFEFNLAEIENDLDIDFDHISYYKSIDFLKFDPQEVQVNIAHEYNKNFELFKFKLKELSINDSFLISMLNYPSQKSLMYLGELDELLKRYKSFISIKDEGEKMVLPDISNISFSSVNTGKVEIRENNIDSTGTKMDIQKTGNSKSYTGLLAEKIVYKYLTEKAESVTEVKWDSENADPDINPNGRAGLGYDIKYKKNGINYFIEVKGTKVYGNKVQLNFSKNEIKFAQRHHDTYQIFICNGATEKKPKIQNIGNIFDNSDFTKKIEGKGYVAIPSGFEIYLEIID